MQNDCHILARLNHLVEVTDPAFAHRTGQRAVDPDSLAALEQIPSDKIRGRQVVMTGHSIERLAQTGGHMLNKAGLAASGRPLEQKGQTVVIGHLEQFAFTTRRLIKRQTWFQCHIHRSFSRNSGGETGLNDLGLADDQQRIDV